MQKKLEYLLCISWLLLLTWSAAAYGQSSGYTIERSVLDGGGRQQIAGELTLYYSIGQASGIAVSSSGQYSSGTGFLANNLEPLGDAVVAQKQSDFQFANYWDTITYSITVQNLFLEPLYFQIEDVFSDGVEYEDGSLWVNGENVSDDGLSGDSLAYLSAPVGQGDTLTLSYQVTISDMVGEIIEHSATITAFAAPNTPCTRTFQGEIDPVLVRIVPEPGTLSLLGIGLFGALMFGRRKTMKSR